MKVAVALGSNLGDRLAHLKRAAEELQALSRAPLRKSAIYENPPVDSPPGASDFLNAAVELEMEDSVTLQDLLKKLKAIERKLGRKPKQVHNEPRPIDLDLICGGDLRVSTADLIVPHPRAHIRAFVLLPLCDLDPDLVLPGQNKTVEGLFRDLSGTGTLRRAFERW
jgi:2-amino-4-hydroxy-6-hydroxymethyldihydropteridine diphosphokinase